ncbi:glycosyltransferase family 8 protein [Karstenula rhodostoma CBS 690.94]|uniref:Glycosyltransferase family 8 protein n=1 Tax=Karstenula rhodostoma CBS 690.94 TaxID=1392251 RepID=A0A9P4PS00_9PLEO|nr:glycosyltransferase family 8 protein [Karstenula rhodostoma CBS 690.94]
MRRWRSVATATLILITVIYLITLNQAAISDNYSFGKPFTEWDQDGFGNSKAQERPAESNDSEAVKASSDLGPHPPESLPNEATPQEANKDLLNIHVNHEPDLALPDSSQLPPPTEPVQVGFQAEFGFQKDLELDLPVDALRKFSNNRPHNYDPTGPKTNVYATFMATNNPSIKDPYYMAIHSLIYRLLWSPKSRSEKYAFVVYVANYVTPEQRELLAGAGAVVRELEMLEWDPQVEGIQSRWKNLFAKLNMWKETEFSRIFSLDADAFPVTNIDAIFETATEQNCIEAKLAPEDYLLDGTSTCEPYVFAGIPQDPFNPIAKNINGGALVFSPSTRMHQRFLQNYLKFDKYDVKLVEQAFLNWQFDINGAFPAQQLERQWNAAFPNDEDEGKVKVVHEKIWNEEREWLKKEWVDEWVAMTQFYMSEAFVNARFLDGLAQG